MGRDFRSRTLPPLGAALTLAALLLTPCIACPAGTGLDATTAQFCAQAQQIVAATQLKSRNVVHSSYDAFARSHPQTRPLQTQQYVLYEDDRNTLPLRVSCKMKTPDRLAAEYGEDAVRPADTSCVDLMRAIVLEVYERMPAEDRARLALAPEQIMLEPDDKTVLGSTWIAPFDFAYLHPEGTLRLRAKSLRIDWDDFFWSWAPERVRGAYYCHVIAPEYLRRLMMGEQSVPQLPVTAG